MLFHLLLQVGRTTTSCRGDGRVRRDWPAPGAPTLPRHGGRLVRWLTVYFRWASHLLVQGLESLYEISAGRWWSTSSRTSGVDKVPELRSPLLWIKLGSDGLVRVQWGAIVRTPSNPRPVARPRNGAEGRVCSGYGQLATSCFPVASEVLGGIWGLPVPGVRNSCRRGYPPASVYILFWLN